jgi:iron-sulfur cluster repair protein YtfE (RIC family)
MATTYLRGSLTAADAERTAEVSQVETVQARRVTDLIEDRPETLDVFNAFGIHSCCGGQVPVRDAARRDQVDLDALTAALMEVLGEDR